MNQVKGKTGPGSCPASFWIPLRTNRSRRLLPGEVTRMIRVTRIRRINGRHDTTGATRRSGWPTRPGPGGADTVTTLLAVVVISTACASSLLQLAG